MPATAKAALPAGRANADALDPIERYLASERALWDRYELEPTERFIEVGSPAVRLRIREVGSGEPVVLVHGTGGPGTWPSLVSRLTGLRCIMLDRPGWGLSAPVDYAAKPYNTLITDLLAGVLDVLALDRAHVAGASIGDNWALRLAQTHPARVGRVVLLGGGPLLPEVRIPTFIRLLASPAGAVMVRMPQKRRMLEAQLRQIGHGPSLDSGRIPNEFIAWRLALARDTAAMRHEREMVRAIATPRGFRPGLTFDDGELAAVEQPVLHVVGTADPVGSAIAWQRAESLLPRGELELVKDAGHVPWFEAPRLVADRVGGFLVDETAS